MGPERTREDQRGPTGGSQLWTFTKIQLGKKSQISPPVPDMLVFSKSMLHVERRFTQIIKGYI